jgi:2Fe-2S ferredoxin
MVDENNIELIIKNPAEDIVKIAAPNDLGLNLMEFLKANEYQQILGTCGGMALCASCHIRVKEVSPELPEQSDDEYGILDSLPEVYDDSRLSCQIKLNSELKNITIEVIGDTE